jgi:hypothetical protein
MIGVRGYQQLRCGITDREDLQSMEKTGHRGEQTRLAIATEKTSAPPANSPAARRKFE